MNNNANHFIRSLIDWVFRRRSLGLSLARLAASLLAVIFVGCALSFSIPTANGPINFSYDSGSSNSWVFCTVVGICLVTLFLGLYLIWLDQKSLQAKKVIAVELRGLRDTSGQPLHASVPNNILGTRDSLLIDIRQGADGTIRNPNDALVKLLTLPSNLSSREAGFSRSDITIVAAGLAPVPFGFLMGCLLDDESSITLMDWDRFSDNWRSLIDTDDGHRFTTYGLANLNGEKEIVLSVSVSYKTDVTGIQNAFPNMPIIDMSFGNITAEGHWSEEKQIALGKQFFETLRLIEGSGVNKIHLILAAPNSLVIRFGRAYDKRNLPKLIIYQYEKSDPKKYPWGIKVPTSNSSAELILK